MITREQVKDLQPGDVVEVTHADWPDGTVVRGPLWMHDGETLQVSRIVIRHWDGRHPYDTGLTLTVISRAPRPLYVNHPRTEPVPGDVVREDDPEGATTWLMDSFRTWQSKDSTHDQDRGFEWPLRLLVDGETGMTVPE
ncbi:MAG: hypothetical protein JWO98_4897 [Frankiales bacterium]|nr:hypothetical protein [Frankiales bacterium]